MAVLLMDFGGVVCRSVLELLSPWATRRGFPVAGARSGPFGSRPDELWERMQTGELTEREYWTRRAAEFGDLLGEQWTSRELISDICRLPEGELVRPEALQLLDAARHAGVPAGVLSNDLEFFHGPEWVANSDILRCFDTVVDGSVTGILKPDPRAYWQAAAQLGVDVSELVFLDDLSWNVDGAARLGATALRVDITDPVPAFNAAAKPFDLVETIVPETGHL